MKQDWNKLIEEYRNADISISMVDFCKFKDISLNDMKYHYYKKYPQIVEVSNKSVKKKSTHSNVYIECKNFKFKLYNGFDKDLFKDIIGCVNDDS
jgi:hypothetical protein